MKILMVAPTPFFSDRGCHVRILGEVHGLRQLGHEVVVCTYPLGREMQGVQTARTWPVPWYRKLSAGPSWHKYYIDLLLVGLVRRWIRRWKPDVIHAHLHEGACVAALALVGHRRIPLVLDYQGSLTEEVVAHRFTDSGKLQHRLLRRVERWINHRADAVITSTSAAVEDLTRNHGVAPDRIRVVTDGVDVDCFQPGTGPRDVRHRYGIPEDRPLLVYTGVLSMYQGIDLLLDALHELKRRRADVHALIVGYPMVEEYQAKAQALGIDDRTTFTGRMPFEAIPELLASADIGVSAKLPSSEGNVKLYTYMAAGLASVAFDTPMNREILADTGVLVQRVDKEALVESLESLLSSKAHREQLGQLARRRAAAHFSWRAVAERITTTYRTVSTTLVIKLFLIGHHLKDMCEDFDSWIDLFVA